MGKPLITISFPVFEADEYVEASLESVLSQDYDNLEILIIDDCGKTNAMKIVEQTLETFPHNHHVRTIHNTRNLKQGGSRNMAIDNAHGEYVFFMDADDVLLPNSISTLVNAMGGKKVDFIKGSYKVIFESGEEKIMKGVKSSFAFDGTTAIDALYAHEEIFWSTMTNAIFNLQFLRDKGIRCIHPYLEDEVFFFNVVTQASHGFFISDITYHQICHSDSTINTIRRTDLKEETARYAMDIVKNRYRTIEDWKNAVTREKCILDTIKWGLHYLYKGKSSPNIPPKRYQDMAKTILTYPVLVNVPKTSLTKRGRRKLWFYKALQGLPLVLRQYIAEQVIFSYYKRVGI